MGRCLFELPVMRHGLYLNDHSESKETAKMMAAAHGTPGTVNRPPPAVRRDRVSRVRRGTRIRLATAGEFCYHQGRSRRIL